MQNALLCIRPACARYRYITKTLLVVKLTVFLLTAAMLNVSARGLSQNITYSGTNVTLAEVFTALEKQSGYLFFYGESVLEKAKPVTIDSKNEPLEQFLNKLFANQLLVYKVRDKNIVVSVADNKRPVFTEPILDAPPITGRVTDSTGAPLVGATISLQGKSKTVTTDAEGRFIIDAEAGDVLIISYVGYTTGSYEIIDKTNVAVTLHASMNNLDEISVVNTGYQTLPKERATGAFSQVDKTLYNRKVGPSILDRLDGVVSGLSFYPLPDGAAKSIPLSSPSERHLGINIRGQSTLSDAVGTDPLIVLDNFPYEGDIRNINPNDVESVTVLKDAAAASIWGARAGNGVIVITTRKGVKNKKLSIDFNINTTIINKPDLKYDPNFLPSSPFIEAEQYLYDQGYFQNDLMNTYNFPVISPVVEILSRQSSGLISAEEANSQLAFLKQIDVRDDLSKYVYQKGLNQQYSLSLRGGTQNTAYAFSAGYDKNKSNLIRNGYERLTLNSMNTFEPLKNLQINIGVNYSKNRTDQNNQMGFGSLQNGGSYGTLIPYSRLVDDNGHPSPIVKNYGNAYKDSLVGLGFLDWQYRPLDEIKNADNYTDINAFVFKTNLRYRIRPFLNAEVSFQNETQKISTWNYYNINTYFTRDLINQFSLYNPSNGSFVYQIPKGGILDMANGDWSTNNIRLQMSFDKAIGNKGYINAIAGTEIRETKTASYNKRTYGYDDEFGTGINNLNFSDFLSTNPNNASTIPNVNGGVNRSLNRFISGYLNTAYSYDQKYIISLSARNDGANIFGVKINDKITPLWSAGFSWLITNEKFVHANWLNSLKARFTYGFNGNVYNGSAYVTGSYSNTPLTNAPSIVSITPANPNLRWEKVKNANIGFDFSLLNNALTGSFDAYQKDGIDLIQPQPLPFSAGFTSFPSNSARTRTRGIDMLLTAQILRRKQLNWSATIILNTIKDKLVKYDVPLTSGSIQNSIPGVVGQPLYSLYSYRWAGLDAQTGNPKGYLKGEENEDYLSIINNYDPDSLVYSGSARPTAFGAFRNDFSAYGFSLSVNIAYQFGSFFRRPSISTNYEDNISTYVNTDYINRWQQPGDEVKTNVPSLSYPGDANRSLFYRYSEVLVTKGDVIRLQDIKLSYNLLKQFKKQHIFSAFEVYSYLNNVGILWRSNPYGLDPNVYLNQFTHGLPIPFSISFGCTMSLQ